MSAVLYGCLFHDRVLIPGRSGYDVIEPGDAGQAACTLEVRDGRVWVTAPCPTLPTAARAEANANGVALAADGQHDPQLVTVSVALERCTLRYVDLPNADPADATHAPSMALQRHRAAVREAAAKAAAQAAAATPPPVAGPSHAPTPTRRPPMARKPVEPPPSIIVMGDEGGKP